MSLSPSNITESGGVLPIDIVKALKEEADAQGERKGAKSELGRTRGRTSERLDAESLHSSLLPSLPSNLRRYCLLAAFVSAQFLDIFGASAAIVGLSQIATALNMTTSESIWIVNAYSLALASSLLTGGRMADTQNPKIVFVCGFLGLGLFSMGVELSRNKDVLLVLRALSGFSASFTILAATRLIVFLFPEPDKQKIALSIFGGSGAVANILGLFLGGCLVQAHWSWIFYFTTLIAVPMSIGSVFCIPRLPLNLPESHSNTSKNGDKDVPARLPKLDLVGAFLLTAAITLFIFGLTSSDVTGWRQPAAISTVIIGGLLFSCFFY